MMQCRILFAVILAALLATGERLRAQDPNPNHWPHLRGPNYDAVCHATDLVNTWPASGPPILWERELGEGYSGIIIAEGRAFTQYQSLAGQFVIALSPDNGAELWRTRVDSRWQSSGAYPGPYATPTWSSGRIYYTTPAGLAGCLDAATGREIWSLNVIQKFRGRGTEFGYAATPLVENGRVILPVGGLEASMVALNAGDGTTAWAVDGDAASYCPAYPITLGGRRLIVGYLRNVIVAYDAATGERVWRQELSNDYDEHSAWPLYSEPNLFITAPFRAGAHTYRLDHSGATVTAKLTWANRKYSNDVCSTVLVNGHIYGFDLQQTQASEHRSSRGRFKCLDFLTGTVKWETDAVAHTTVLAVDGKLVLLTDTGVLILARLNSERYEELGRSQVLEGNICWTPPTLSDGQLYVRDHTRVKCLYLGSYARPVKAIPNAATRVVSQFNWSIVIPYEPEFPHDAPSVREIGLWFAWCILGVFAPAIATAVVIGAIALANNTSKPKIWANTALFTVAMILGTVGTTLYSHWAGTFVLIWPSVLYVAFRIAVLASANAQSGGRREKRVARFSTLGLIAICFAYFELCRAIGYMMAWTFLGGLLPAMPMVVWAERTQGRWRQWIIELAAFAVYFWISGLFPGWKDGWSRR